jgi:hypothetical protein
MSDRSPAEKLLIRPGTSVWMSHPQHIELIEPLPEGVRVVDRPELATTVFIFGDDAQSLRNAVAAHANRLAHSETLWFAYPTGNGADIDRHSLWPILAEHGLWPVGLVSLDDRWTAMRVRPLKPGDPPFTGGAASGSSRPSSH